MNHQIDLYALQLLRLVAEHRNFSAAALEAGISQSALSRQVAKLESRLDLKLFERSTRRVTITEAGAILLRDTAAIPNLLDGALRRLREECLQAPPEIKVALSNELSLAHIPGIFTTLPDGTKITVSQCPPSDLIKQLSEARFDLGIFAAPQALPESLKITHRMSDRFCLIAPKELAPPSNMKSWINKQRWILPPSESPARNLIQQSYRSLKPAMELENFDLMVQFVALEMGCAFVPRRCLSNFKRKSSIQKIKTPKKIQRDLLVATPKHLKASEQVESFIKSILFS